MRETGPYGERNQTAIRGGVACREHQKKAERREDGVEHRRCGPASRAQPGQERGHQRIDIGDGRQHTQHHQNDLQRAFSPRRHRHWSPPEVDARGCRASAGRTYGPFAWLAIWRRATAGCFLAMPAEHVYVRNMTPLMTARSEEHTSELQSLTNLV